MGINSKFGEVKVKDLDKNGESELKQEKLIRDKIVVFLISLSFFLESCNRLTIQIDVDIINNYVDRIFTQKYLIPREIN